jgi:hypothetical protein
MKPASAERLWHDPSIYQQRYQKSVAGLAALQAVIAQQPIFSEFRPDFTALCQAIQRLDSKAFTTVWSAPTAQYWQQIAYELVKVMVTPQPVSSLLQTHCLGVCTGLRRRTGASLAADNFSEIFKQHLQGLKGLVLAMHYLAQVDWVVPGSSWVELPLLFAGTALYLEGQADEGWADQGQASSTIEILALKEGRLHLRHAGEVTGKVTVLPLLSGETAVGITVKTCPVVHHQGYELLLQPYVFQQPGSEYGAAVLAQSLEGLVEDSQDPQTQDKIAQQAQYLPLVQQALDLIQTYQPEVYQQMRLVLKVLALKPEDAGNYTNVSDFSLPGAVVCSVYNQPLELADILIHEFHSLQFWANQLWANRLWRNRFWRKQRRLTPQPDPSPLATIPLGDRSCDRCGDYYMRSMCLCRCGGIGMPYRKALPRCIHSSTITFSARS